MQTRRRSTESRHASLWVTLPLLLFSPGMAAAARPLPWARLGGADDLLQSERETAATALRRFHGYVGCSAAIASCLTVKPEVPAAWRLARYVVFLAGKGLDEEEIAEALALRKDSVVPAKIHKIPLAGVPRMGAENAPVIIVEYADFRCHHCAAVSPLLKALLRRWPKKVGLYFKPYALGPGSSVVAARAALAAHRQGRYWQLQELLFANPDKHTPAGVVELAKRAKLDTAAFAAAMRDRALLQQIDLLKVEGLRLGIKGTPTLFINGKLHRMPKDARHLEERIADELDLLAKKKE